MDDSAFFGELDQELEMEPGGEACRQSEPLGMHEEGPWDHPPELAWDEFPEMPFGEPPSELPVAERAPLSSSLTWSPSIVETPPQSCTASSSSPSASTPAAVLPVKRRLSWKQEDPSAKR